MSKIIGQNYWPYASWMAHRGGGKLVPENTIQGFRAGYQFGLQGVEFDVKLTKDKQSVVIHDDDLQRVADIDLKVKDLLLEEIMQIDVGVNFPKYQPAYVPSFKEVANFCIQNNISTNVEIKPCLGREGETAEIVVRDALEYWKNSQIPPLFSSFSLESLQVIHKLYPDALRGLLVEDWPEDDASEIIANLKALGCVSLHAPHKDLTREKIAQVKEAGYVVLAWTVNDIPRGQDLLSWGVASVITDLIDRIPGGSINN